MLAKIGVDTLRQIEGLGMPGIMAAAELRRRAFGIVTDAAKAKSGVGFNWKDPIDVAIAPDMSDFDDEALVDSVIFMTGGPAMATPLRDGRLRIVAHGYYVSVGA